MSKSPASYSDVQSCFKKLKTKCGRIVFFKKNLNPNKGFAVGFARKQIST